MGDVLTVAKARVSPLQRNSALDLYHRAFESGEIGAIAKAITLWESSATPGSFLLVARYEDEERADEAVEATSTSEAYAQLIQLMEAPADIQRYRIAGERGVPEYEVAIGSCLSLSVRSADPGLGWDLNAELARILDEIALLPGFLGSMHGRSAKVHEEVMSIALWADEDSYRASVPSHHLFVLNSYNRVA